MAEIRCQPSVFIRRFALKLLFPFTDAYRAAFDLYLLQRRGMIIGADSATGLIRETIKSGLTGSPA